MRLINDMKALVFKHIAVEGPAMLGEFLRERGWIVDEFSLDKGEFPRHEATEDDLIVSLGGPMSVNESDRYTFLEKEGDYLLEAIEKGVPTIGVCLGAQLIAKILGASVKKNKSYEIGWYPLYLTEDGLEDKLFNGIPGKFDVFHWHGEFFEIPQGAKLLASSDLCKNQVFRFKSHVFGFQCHLELNEKAIREWIACYDEEIKAIEEFVKPDKILSDTNEKFPSYKEIFTRVFSNLMDILY